MNSEEISIISTNRFIQKFILSVIQSIKINSLQYEDRGVINSDLVPRTSEKTMQASLKEKVIPRIHTKRKDLSFLVAPIKSPKIIPMRRRQQVRQIETTPQKLQTQIMPPTISQEKQSEALQDYGKITPLLNDPSVSTIECRGAGILLTIIRAGQKQTTRISLSQKDIKEILNKISENTHIPLLEGVFRAAVDNFSINAIISETIGSRFVIKKQTAYALLEK